MISKVDFITLYREDKADQCRHMNEDVIARNEATRRSRLFLDEIVTPRERDAMTG
jgi:hypothetical protein